MGFLEFETINFYFSPFFKLNPLVFVSINKLGTPDNTNTFSCHFGVSVSQVPMSKRSIQLSLIAVVVLLTQHGLCHYVDSIASAPLISVRL